MSLLVRFCSMGFSLPPSLAQFLSDLGMCTADFGWSGAGEAKAGTFGAGRDALFFRFLDLQEVAESLGCHGSSLRRLSLQVLGAKPAKSERKSRRSDYGGRRRASRPSRQHRS